MIAAEPCPFCLGTYRSAIRAEAEQKHEAIVAQVCPVGFV